MADINIGKISQTETDKGKAKLIYHILTEKPVAGIVPTHLTTTAITSSINFTR